MYQGGGLPDVAPLAPGASLYRRPCPQQNGWYDYIHMAFNGDYQGGKTTDQLLDQYGASVILMNGFDFKGHVFWLPAALADPSQKVSKLVYTTLNRSATCARPRQGCRPVRPNVAHGLPILCAQSLGKCSHVSATGRGLASGLTTTWPPTDRM
jgi:hypothetical protein